MTAKTMTEIVEAQDQRTGQTTLDRLRAGSAAEVQLRMTYEELLATLTRENELIDASLAGDGFIKPPNNETAKEQLVGVPFIILDWRRNPGDYGPYYSIRVVTEANKRLIINDGSTGLAMQLHAIVKTGYAGAISCPHGLTVSRYPVQDRDVICPGACQGQRFVEKVNAKGQTVTVACPDCEGTGHELLRDQNDNVLRGATFYVDDSA